MFRLVRFMKPYRGMIALVLILVFAQVLTELYLPALMADIVDIGVLHGDTGFILRMGGLMLLIAAFGMACTIAASYFSARLLPVSEGICAANCSACKQLLAAGV